MFERLAQIETRYDEIESEMAKPETIANMEEYKKTSKIKVVGLLHIHNILGAKII